MKIYDTGNRHFMIVSSKGVLTLQLDAPHVAFVYFNPADAAFDLKYRAKELHPKSQEYKEVVDKHKELLNLMQVDWEEGKEVA